MQIHPIGVAHIAKVYPDGRVRITFDGYSNEYDYDCGLDDEDLHPVGFCQSVEQKLEAPKGYQGEFRWPTYLKEIHAAPVSWEL